jgi:Ca2+-binding EF-hand superfamily protein
MAERDEPEKLMVVFKLFDVDGKGSIVMRDIKRIAKEIDHPLKEWELEMMMRHVDKDGGGEITPDEWLRLQKRN